MLPEPAALPPAKQAVERPGEQRAVLGVARRRCHHLDASHHGNAPARPCSGRQCWPRSSERNTPTGVAANTSRDPSAAVAVASPETVPPSSAAIRSQAGLTVPSPQPSPRGRGGIGRRLLMAAPPPARPGCGSARRWSRAMPAALTAVSSAVVTTGTRIEQPAFQASTQQPRTTS